MTLWEIKGVIKETMLDQSSNYQTTGHCIFKLGYSSKHVVAILEILNYGNVIE